MKNIFLILLLPFLGFTQFNPIFFSSVAKKNLNENLVAYYKLNSDATDVINGNNGTLINSPSFNSGIQGNAIDFINDTTLRYFTNTDNDNFSFTNGVSDIPFSMSFWVYPYVIGGAQFNVIITKRGLSSGANAEYQILIGASGEVQLILFSTIASNFIGIQKTGITANNWHHVVVTYDGSGITSGLKLYINGVGSGTSPLSGGTYSGMINTTFNNYFGIASHTIQQDRKLKGKLDEFAVWKNRVLTQRDVDRLYNIGLGITYPLN